MVMLNWISHAHIFLAEEAHPLYLATISMAETQILYVIKHTAFHGFHVNNYDYEGDTMFVSH